jgi:hypothetical protein
VMETAERTECYTVMQPVTTFRTECVDQGCYVDQVACQPGRVRNRLRWQPGACVVDPLTGMSYYDRAGLVWVPEQGPSRQVVTRVWQPNLVTRQVPVTQHVARQVTRKVPVQVCRNVDEQRVRKVPYQVCRTVHEAHVRKVPYQVCRQVVERIEQKVPEQVCRMVAEQRVRRVPVTTCRMVYEQKVEPYQVQVCRMVASQETVRVPRIVEKRIPVTYTYRVPRTVVMRVPIEDPCAPVCCTAAPAMGAATSVMAPATPLGATRQETRKVPTPQQPTPAAQPSPASPREEQLEPTPGGDPATTPGPFQSDAAELKSVPPLPTQPTATAGRGDRTT